MKTPPFGSFVFPPYFAHNASCVMLNIDWTPLCTVLCIRVFLPLWRINVHKRQICRHKTAMGHFPHIFEAPYLRNYWSDTKSQGGPKNGADMLYPHAKFGGDLPPHGGERKNGCFWFVCMFVCLFVCLFVTLTVCVSLGYRR